MSKQWLYFQASINLCHCKSFLFLELESHISRSQSTHKSKKKRASLLSNPIYENLHYVNKNFQPDFHKDGKK